MRKVIASTFISLDGVMQAPGGTEEDRSGGFKSGGWQAPFADESDDVAGAAMQKLLAPPYDLLLGRRTYEIFAAYWPFQDDPIGKGFTSARKYVATRTLKDLTWKNSVAIRDAATDVARLKQQDGPPLRIWGSGNLIQTLLKNGLIDEFTVLIYPVLLGKGKRLFADDAVSGSLTLTGSAISKRGVFIASYEPAGPVKTGTFVGDKPSEAEVQRREKVKREG